MSAQPRATHQLANKTYLVLGGSSGIGFGVASTLIEENATVIVASSSASKVEAAVKKLSDPSFQYNSDPRRISGYIVNLKGEDTEKSLEELRLSRCEAFGTTILEAGQVRFVSAILSAKVGSKYIKEGGTITFTTGIVAVKPIPKWPVLSGYTAGLIGLVRGLALDLSSKKIRVNAVSPGFVDTQWDASDVEKDKRAGLVEYFKKSSLTKSVGLPHQIAQSYLYLLKDTSTTGETIFSDSGSRYAV